MLAGTQLAAQQQAVIARHHDVEHDQVHRRGFQKRPHLPPIGDHGGAQTIFLQVVAHQFPDLAVVIDDQDMVDMVHRCYPFASVVDGHSKEAPWVCPWPFVLQCIRVGRGYRTTQKMCDLALQCIAVYPETVWIRAEPATPIGDTFTILAGH
ncbi:hypothetical protein D3C85_914540 [compost metagenome]